MLRWGLMLAVFTLSGCESLRSRDDRSVEIAVPANFTDAKCRNYARQRANDGAVFGYAVDVQTRILRDVYANCIAGAH
jgi:hypothetical protein